MVGVTNLSDEVSSAMSPDVEYRMREIIQVRSNQFVMFDIARFIDNSFINYQLVVLTIHPLYFFELRMMKLIINKGSN